MNKEINIMAGAIYFWQGFDRLNQLQQGELLSRSAFEAKQQLLLLGVIPIKIQRRCRFSSRHWHMSDRIYIAGQLGVMLQAGLSLVNTLQLLAEQHASPAWRYVLNTLKDHIIKGHSFSDALNQFPMIFPGYFRQIMATGEITGNLAESCLQLAQQQEQLLAMQKKIIKALRYPLFILVIVVAVALLMLLLVLPEFAEIYKSVGAQLPPFTQGLILFSQWLRRYVWIGTLMSMIAVYTYRHYRRNHADWRFREQQSILRIPYCGKLIVSGCLARIFRTLTLTQRAGINLADGLQVAANSVEHPVFQHKIINYRKTISQGTPFYLALRQDKDIPVLISQFIEVAEVSGTLDNMLERLSQLYEQQVAQQTEQLTEKLEPALMIFLSIIVGGLVIAMYLPLLQLGQVIQ